MEAKKFTIKQDRELIRDHGKWILVRKSLGVTSFGINMVDLAPGDSIPEHTEIERNQEEVFMVLAGDATMVINRDEHNAPQGTFVRLDPEPKRYVRNDGNKPVRILIVSAPRTSGYEPMDWA
jgi:quercetin dioxygenase-like cupin family protein